MTAEDRTTLKSYFQTGDRPTQTQFENLIDSALTLSASTGTALHSTACLAASPGLAIAQSGSTITYAFETQSGACAFLFLPDDVLGANASATGAASVVHLKRFFLPYKITVDDVYFYINTACDAGLGGVGIYSGNGASLLVNAAGQSCSPSGSRLVSLAACVTLNPGFYIQAHVANLAGVIFAGAETVTGLNQAILYNLGTVHMGTGGNGSGGTLPSTVGTIASANIIPAVFKLQG